METIRTDTIGSSPQKHFYVRTISRILKYPKTILCTILLITIVLGFQISGLETRFSIYDLFAEELPETQSYYRSIGASTYWEDVSLINYYSEREIRQNFLLFPLLIYIFIALLLVILLRKTTYILIILTSIVLSQIWTLGIVALFGWPLTHLSFTAIMFLLSVKTLLALHISAICLNNSKSAATIREAVCISFSGVPYPAILSVVIIIMSLIPYLFSPIDAICQFGIYTTTGMTTFMVLIFFIFPLGLYLFPDSRLKSGKKDKYHTDDWINRWTRFISGNQRYRHYVMPFLAVISIFSLIGIIRMENEPDSLNHIVFNTDNVETHMDSALFLKMKSSGIQEPLAASSAHLISGEIKSSVIALIILFGTLWFLLVSIKVNLIALIPSIFPILFAYGVMGWLGINYNIFTPLISTICIGFAAVNVVHYITCYNDELKKNDSNRYRASEASINLTSIPITKGAVVIGLAFSILCFSDFNPIIFFGVLMMLTMLATVAANLFILPVFLHKVEMTTIRDLLHLKLKQFPSKNIPLFKGLVPHQIQSILTTGTLQKLTPKEILFNKGDMSDTMYAIISGSLDIINIQRYEDESGVHEIQKVVNRLQAGDVVGEMGFFRSKQRSATVVALENTELLQINWKMIQRLQWLYPVTAQKFFINLMGIICDRLENITKTLCDQSLIDELTGLFNKKGFTQLLETETNRAHRYREELTVCLIGLDLKNNLSSDNPNATEVMIRTVCQMLSREIRRTDILSRIDSTTFAMVAPKTSQTQAGILCKRLREILHRNLLGFGSSALKIRLAAANMVSGSQETGMDLFERGLALLQNAQE